MGNAIGRAVGSLRQCSCCRTDVSHVVTTRERFEVDDAHHEEGHWYHNDERRTAAATSVGGGAGRPADPPPHVVHDDDDDEPCKGDPIRQASHPIAEQHHTPIPPRNASGNVFSEDAGAADNTSASSSGGYEMPEEQPQEQQAAVGAFVGMGQDVGGINLSIATAAASPPSSRGVVQRASPVGERRSSLTPPAGSGGHSPSPVRPVPPRQGAVGVPAGAGKQPRGRASWDRSGSSSDSEADGVSGSRRAQLMLTRLRERHLQQQQQQQQQPHEDDDDDGDGDGGGPREDMPDQGALRW